jgi:hypothetical protein
MPSWQFWVVLLLAVAFSADCFRVLIRDWPYWWSHRSTEPRKAWFWLSGLALCVILSLMVLALWCRWGWGWCCA